jgi:hypothetical protein
VNWFELWFRYVASSLQRRARCCSEYPRARKPSFRRGLRSSSTPGSLAQSPVREQQLALTSKKQRSPSSLSSRRTSAVSGWVQTASLQAVDCRDGLPRMRTNWVEPQCLSARLPQTHGQQRWGAPVPRSRECAVLGPRYGKAVTASCTASDRTQPGYELTLDVWILRY